MTTIRVAATGNGRIVGRSELKQGKLVDTSRLARFFLTITLTDVITDLCALAASLDRDYRIVLIRPNGLLTSSLEIKLVGTGFEIVCWRRLVRGRFPLNPFAAEFGSNYDVLVLCPSRCPMPWWSYSYMTWRNRGPTRKSGEPGAEGRDSRRTPMTSAWPSWQKPELRCL
jgi:hypothetical protein